MIRITIFVILLMFFCDLKSQEKLFDKKDVLKIEIVTNLRELFKDVNPESAKYHPAFISYIDTQGNSVNIDVKLKTRGIFRRSKENCNIPPLIVKFVDEELNSTIFKEIDKIKLVNSCNKRSQTYQQFILKEYLVYRLYNLFTEYSFKVRLVKIVYIDINNYYPPFESFGFFIEEMSSVTKRTNSKYIKTLGIIQEAVDRQKMNQTAIFQYMIGNTDWSVPKQHNIKLVVSESSLIPIAIPYDFDFCGFVNPPYTKPPEIIPIKNVTDRYYRGFCRPLNEIEQSLRIFFDKKDSIYNLIHSDTLLDSKNKKMILNYIDEFYYTINDKKTITQEFIDNCRKE